VFFLQHMVKHCYWSSEMGICWPKSRSHRQWLFDKSRNTVYLNKNSNMKPS